MAPECGIQLVSLLVANQRAKLSDVAPPRLTIAFDSIKGNGAPLESMHDQLDLSEMLASVGLPLNDQILKSRQDGGIREVKIICID